LFISRNKVIKLFDRNDALTEQARAFVTGQTTGKAGAYPSGAPER